MQDVADETERLRAHLLLSSRWEEMLVAVAGLARAGFSDGAISAAVGELLEQLVASVLGGTAARRQNRGSDLRMPDGHTVEVKARIANTANRLNRQFNFRRTSADADWAYCLTWTLEEGRPILDQAIRARMSVLIGQGAQKALGSYCVRTTHGGLRRLLESYGGTVVLVEEETITDVSP